MKYLLLFALSLLPLAVNAGIEYRSWNSESKYKVLETVGIHTYSDGLIRAVLNFQDGSQLLLTGNNAHVGLALINREDQCLTIMRDKNAVSIIPNCKK